MPSQDAESVASHVNVLAVDIEAITLLQFSIEANIFPNIPYHCEWRFLTWWTRSQLGDVVLDGKRCIFSVWMRWCVPSSMPINLHARCHIPRITTLHSKTLMKASLDKHLLSDSSRHDVNVYIWQLLLLATVMHRANLHGIVLFPSKLSLTDVMSPFPLKWHPVPKVVPWVRCFPQLGLQLSLRTFTRFSLADIVNMSHSCWHSFVTSMLASGAS